jgi:inner membrane protein
MSGRTHALVPAGLASILFNSDPLLTLTAAIAGLVPDIDEPYSVIGQRLWFLAWWIKYLCGHRTVSHSLLGVMVVGVVGLLMLVPSSYVLAMCLGWGSHLILDALSGGIPLWWPSKERWVLGRYPIYGGVDRMLMLGGMLLFLVSFWMRVESEVTHPNGELQGVVMTGDQQ